jgi:2-polyprenyl-3-methyl-5-hydroxy-6-metoxy-1,4-benzoquinol methylase
MSEPGASLFVERKCPACENDAWSLVFEVVIDDFSRVNPTYRLDRLPELGIAADWKCPIVRCEECGFVYSRYRLNDELATFLYNHIIDHDKSRAKVFGRTKRLRLLTLWKQLFEEATREWDSCEVSVLDFGCGWGDFLTVARAPGITVCGLDTDEQKLDWGRQQGLHLVSRLEDLEPLGPFDILYCDQVMEHLDTPAASARQMLHYLKPGGVAFVGVPCCTQAVIDDVCVRLKDGQPISKEINPWEHLNYFSPDSLVRMMQSAGFEVINLFRPDKPRGWRRWLRRRNRPYPLAASTSLFCRWPGMVSLNECNCASPTTVAHRP